ncbi:flagellar biosynthetic protein FliO [Rossellomorea aquimaris]|uniref:flagellar biosynthetic protein FliO n=1 Tax=Rossellomorea aquimaris TaxID=189382 RepID=UPI0009EDBE4D|nr:flagellar biosynthetic protein FliO [Rossellomorea aquimaris]
MKKIQNLFSFILFLLLVSAVDTTALADVDNVKSCIEHPEKCKNQQGNEINSSDTDTSVSTSVTFIDYVKMILALIFVVALIYILLKFINQKGRSFQQTKIINHLGGTPLGGNRSVQIVKVGNQVLVLGVGEDIQLLKEVQDEKEKEEILSFYHESPSQMADAKNVLSTWLGKGPSSSQKDSGNSFQSLLKSQLDEMSKGRKKLFQDLKKKENHSDE